MSCSEEEDGCNKERGVSHIIAEVWRHDFGMNASFCIAIAAEGFRQQRGGIFGLAREQATATNIRRKQNKRMCVKACKKGFFFV